jgi:MFS-type transporter involved in bile tolerance (Atg22 family)
MLVTLIVYMVVFITKLSNLTAGAGLVSLPGYMNVLAVVIVVTLIVVIVSLLFSMRSNKPFLLWFVNRTLFWGGFIAVNSFLINYCVDVLGMSRGGAQEFYGNLKMLLGGALIILALTAGWLSDKFGRKPVMITSGLVAFAGALILVFAKSLTPNIAAFVQMVGAPDNVWLLFFKEKTTVIIAGVIIGMGIGAFLSASWALATDIVPREEAARYLGIANIATCLGSGIARLLGGVLIDPINKALGSNSSGYQLLYVLVTIFFLFSALVILPLPNKKKA